MDKVKKQQTILIILGILCFLIVGIIQEKQIVSEDVYVVRNPDIWNPTFLVTDNYRVDLISLIGMLGIIFLYSGVVWNYIINGCD